jgi:uncharacterized protein
MSALWFIAQIIGFLVLIVLTQDIHVFPGVLFSLFKSSSRDPKTLPSGVESAFITTVDGKRLEVWHLPAAEGIGRLPYVGIVFHGNGASLEKFIALQLWFHYMGIPSYGFDYRGFGKSTGWPSEKGIDRDSDALWDYIVRREQIDASRVIVLGYSVGGAPAARVAAIHQPRLLVLVSAFTTLKNAIREQPLLGFLAPFCWYKLATIDYVRKLRVSSLILAHGERDSLVLPHHTADLRDAYAGTGGVERITSKTAGHNTVFFVIQDELANAVTRYI